MQGCDLTKNNLKNPEKWVADLGVPFGREDKAYPGCLILEVLQTLHIPTNKKTRGLDTIQATSFFPWWLLLFLQEHFEAICKKILRNHILLMFLFSVD